MVWTSHLLVFQSRFITPPAPGLAPGGLSQNFTEFSGMNMVLNSVPHDLSQGPCLSCVLKGYDPDGKGTLHLLAT